MTDKIYADQLKFIGDFGTSTAREIGIHDSVFIAQDIDTAKWNKNANPQIKDSTLLPHLTILGTGDSHADFYSFEITEEMLDDALQAGVQGVRAFFDIDHGFERGDKILWASLFRLWALEDPIDPTQPRLPTLLKQGPGFSFILDPGSTLYWDDQLDYVFTEAGKYYIEVTAWYPFGSDGVPQGVDYQLHVSIDQHEQDTFLFAPQPVQENELANNTGQDLDPADDPGANFFTLNDPAVGNSAHGGGSIDFTTPYARVQGSGDGSYDIYTF